jgi:hypothetical protein
VVIGALSDAPAWAIKHIDDNQQYCLNELRAELREVGVREGVWQGSAAEHPKTTIQQWTNF